MTILRVLAFILLCGFASAADVTTDISTGISTGIATGEVAYVDQGVKLSGFFARPIAKSATPLPAVLVVHEWWGLNDYVRQRTRELAEAGYIAMAIDMYGAGVQTKDAAQAGALATPFMKDRKAMRARAHAGLAELLKLENVDANRVAAIGFCFGGTTSLELARAGEPLVGVVSFHGGLTAPEPAAAGAIKARVLVLAGGADPHVPPQDVAAFMEEMTKAKATWRMETYGGAMHAFTNPAANAPDHGLMYDADAEKRAMAAMKAFFTEIFAP